MPHSPNIHAYGDIDEQLATLLAGGGGTVEFDTRPQAFVWRARAYKYRALLRDQQRNPEVPNYVPTTPYDKMIISLAEGESKVTVKFERPRLGVITTFNEPVVRVTPFNDATSFDPDAALAAAEKLLGGEK